MYNFDKNFITRINSNLLELHELKKKLFRIRTKNFN